MLYRGVLSFNQINSRTGVTVATIGAICNGRNHTWLSKYTKQYARMLVVNRSLVNKKMRIDYTKLLGKYPKVISPEGLVYSIPEYGASIFATTHGLNNKALSEILHGKGKSHRGWKVYLD
jgi:hypothetical protein